MFRVHVCIFILVSFNLDVEILFPTAMTVKKKAGVATVCARLSKNSHIQREVVVELSTKEGTGEGNLIILFQLTHTILIIERKYL